MRAVEEGSMPVWEDIADARIRAWLAQPPEERAEAPPQTPGLPLEVSLFEDIQTLDRARREASDPATAAALKSQADDLMLRLMVLLEGQGRPLAARHYREVRAGRTEPSS